VCVQGGVVSRCLFVGVAFAGRGGGGGDVTLWGGRGGTQFTCFTGRKVQILTQKALQEGGGGGVVTVDACAGEAAGYSQVACVCV
jgi:hypothetical protein